jgi:hypothetical protein
MDNLVNQGIVVSALDAFQVEFIIIRLFYDRREQRWILTNNEPPL